VNPTTQALTLSQLNAAITRAVASAPGTQNVWIVAETADVRVSGGHCYMELIEKDPNTGRQLAKARANIWASTFSVISHQFQQAAGRPFGSDMKVMVRVTASFHPLYGFSLNINAIDPTYTAGDLLRRRAEIIARLNAEGILDMNRSLPWPDVPSRIAIISAPGAAGYGDFCRQLFLNPYRLRFTGRLFPAIMQGERSAESIINALDRINADADEFDCVVIIRGGGATSDLSSFESYDLAANIAQYPIPVIIGIGHERDITLLDYVANMRVKTPTAAAAWLVGRGADALARLQQFAATIHRSVSERIGGCRQQLEYIRGTLPAAAEKALFRASNRLMNIKAGLAAIPDSRLRPQAAHLDGYARTLSQAVGFAIDRQRRRLDSATQLLDVLSPEATLRRGYSITRIDGHAITSATSVAHGAVIETILASGTLRSTVDNVNTPTANSQQHSND